MSSGFNVQEFKRGSSFEPLHAQNHSSHSIHAARRPNMSGALAPGSLGASPKGVWAPLSQPLQKRERSQYKRRDDGNRQREGRIRRRVDRIRCRDSGIRRRVDRIRRRDSGIRRRVGGIRCGDSGIRRRVGGIKRRDGARRFFQTRVLFKHAPAERIAIRKPI
jgi:hypothetical protein